MVLDADPETSRIYAGFRDGVTDRHFRAAMEAKAHAADAAQLHPEHRATACSWRPAPSTPSGRTSCCSRCSRPATSPTGCTTGTGWTRRPASRASCTSRTGLSARTSPPGRATRSAGGERPRSRAAGGLRVLHPAPPRPPRRPFPVGAAGHCRVVVGVEGPGPHRAGTAARYPVRPGERGAAAGRGRGVRGWCRTGGGHAPGVRAAGVTPWDHGDRPERGPRRGGRLRRRADAARHVGERLLRAARRRAGR